LSLLDLADQDDGELAELGIVAGTGLGEGLGKNLAAGLLSCRGSASARFCAALPPRAGRRSRACANLGAERPRTRDTAGAVSRE
jgi:hypothetical protein